MENGIKRHLGPFFNLEAMSSTISLSIQSMTNGKWCEGCDVLTTHTLTLSVVKTYGKWLLTTPQSIFHPASGVEHHSPKLYANDVWGMVRGL